MGDRRKRIPPYRRLHPLYYNGGGTPGPNASPETTIPFTQVTGTIDDSQVPESAVTQHSAAVLDNAALTGSTTADALEVSGPAGINGKSAAVDTAAPAVATDLATALTLLNDMRQRLIDFGLYT